MDEGLIQILFFLAIFILFPLMEQAAKKKKREQKERQRRAEEAMRAASGEDVSVRAESPQTSESILPEDLWEELAELAGTTRDEFPFPMPEPVPEPVPDPEPSVPAQAERSTPAYASREEMLALPEEEPSRPREVRSRESRPREVRRTRSTRSPTRKSRVAPAAAKRRATGHHPSGSAIVRELIASTSGKDALRRAILFAEVLGPPKAERSDPFDERV